MALIVVSCVAICGLVYSFVITDKPVSMLGSISNQAYLKKKICHIFSTFEPFVDFSENQRGVNGRHVSVKRGRASR